MNGKMTIQGDPMYPYMFVLMMEYYLRRWSKWSKKCDYKKITSSMGKRSVYQKKLVTLMSYKWKYGTKLLYVNFCRLLSQNKQKLWIVWVHTYYIKKQRWNNMKIPKQASWMIRKILNTRKWWGKHEIRD